MLRIAALASAAIVGIYVVSFLFVDRGADIYASFWDGWLGNLAETVPAAFLGVAALLRRRNRRVWVMFLLGASLNVVGSLAELRYGRILPTVPSSALRNVPYLLSYVCFVIGAAALAYRAAQSHASLTIEGVNRVWPQLGIEFWPQLGGGRSAFGLAGVGG